MTKIHVGGIGVFRKKFNTLEEASMAARYGDDIILHKNVTVLGNCIIDSGVSLEGNNHTVTTTTGKIAIIINNSERVEIRNINFKVRKQSVAIKIINSKCIIDNITMKYARKYNPRELYTALQVTESPKLEIQRSVILTSLEIEKTNTVIVDHCNLGAILQSPASTILCDNYNSQDTSYANTYVRAQKGISSNDKSEGNLYFSTGSYTIKNLRAGLNLSEIKPKQLEYLKKILKEGKIDFDHISLVAFYDRGKFIVDNILLESNQETIDVLNNVDVKCISICINNSNITLKNSVLSKVPAEFHSGTLTFENTQDEIDWRYDPDKITISSKNSTSTLINTSPTSVKTNVSALQEIDNQIGQKAVKKKLREIVSMAQQELYQKRLAERTGKIYNSNNVFSNHMIFSGAAGTGKTTFARLVGKALFESGVLPEDKFTEASPKDLVAGYVGQTRTKTHDLIMKSLGGVLFIDEAYGLNENGQNASFNKEAIEQLIADMENNRDKLIVIMAGYTKNMRDFIENGNEGLRSRFNNWVEFKDYNDEELNAILLSMLDQQNAILSEEVKLLLFQDGIQYLSHKINGNGRFVRNLVQKIMEKKALRLSYRTDIDSLDPEEQYYVLNAIETADVEDAVLEMLKQHNLIEVDWDEIFKS